MTPVENARTSALKRSEPSMNHTKLRVFSGRANRPLAERIARCLGDHLGNLKVESFPDTETSVRIEEDVRGRENSGGEELLRRDGPRSHEGKRPISAHLQLRVTAG